MNVALGAFQKIWDAIEYNFYTVGLRTLEETWTPLQLLKKVGKFKTGYKLITGSLGCQNSPICHVKVCYDYISQASPPIDYPTKNCSRQQQGDKFFSLFVYITCYFVIDHLNVIGWLNVDHSVFQKEELWLALIYVCSNCIPFYIIYVSLVWPSLSYEPLVSWFFFPLWKWTPLLKIQFHGVELFLSPSRATF